MTLPPFPPMAAATILLMLMPVSAKASESALESRCTLGTASSCYALGDIHVQRNLSSSMRNAAKWYKKSCNLSLAKGCDAAGTMYFLSGSGVSKSEARSLFSKACSLGHSGACGRLKRFR